VLNFHSDDRHSISVVMELESSCREHMTPNDSRDWLNYYTRCKELGVGKSLSSCGPSSKHEYNQLQSFKRNNFVRMKRHDEIKRYNDSRKIKKPVRREKKKPAPKKKKYRFSKAMHYALKY